MLKCVLIFAVLGLSTSYQHHGYGHYPSHPPQPPHRPDEWHPGHEGYHGHSGSWHYGDYHGGYGQFGPDDDSQSNNDQWPKPNPSQISQYPSDDSDYPSDTDSDAETEDGNVPSKTEDQMKKPDKFHQVTYAKQNDTANQGFGQTDITGHIVSNSEPFKFNDRDNTSRGNIPSKESSNSNPHLNNNPKPINSEPFKFNDRDDTGRGDIPIIPSKESSNTNPRRNNNPKPINSEPFKFSDRNDTGRGDIPNIPSKESSNTNPRRNNAKPTAPTNLQTSNRYAKPVANKTNENNTTLTQAYITGPDNTLVKDSRDNDTITSPRDSSKLTGTTLHASNKGSGPVTDKEPAKQNYPTTPGPVPSIGSHPVPALGQFRAPFLQWNVGIYTKTTTPYSQICGGSLVKTDAVLTAAHCFWSDDGGALRPALFAAAAGKLVRSWEDTSDVFAQQSDINQIHIPPRFQGAKTSFQDDIAIARLTTPFEYAPGVKPVCVDFDMALEKQHLSRAGGNTGTIVGWGLTEPNGPPSERLNFLELPYLEIVECLKLLPPSFIKYVTSDKICAGDSRSGLAACKGDSGGGLVFNTNNIPYIRGIVSTAPRDANDCNAFTPATFTQISSHITFLTDHIPNIAEGCRMLYDVQIETDDSTGDLENGRANVAENCRAGEVQNKTVGSAENKNGGDSNSFPAVFHLSSKSGERRECNCFCN